MQTSHIIVVLEMSVLTGRYRKTAFMLQGSAFVARLIQVFFFIKPLFFLGGDG